MICPYCGAINRNSKTCNLCGKVLIKTKDKTSKSKYKPKPIMNYYLKHCIFAILAFFPTGWVALSLSVYARSNIDHNHYNEAKKHLRIVLNLCYLSYFIFIFYSGVGLMMTIGSSSKLSSIGEIRMKLCVQNMKKIESEVVKYNSANKIEIRVLDKNKLQLYGSFPECLNKGKYSITKYNGRYFPIIHCSKHGTIEHPIIPKDDDDRTILTKLGNWLKK